MATAGKPRRRRATAVPTTLAAAKAIALLAHPLRQEIADTLAAMGGEGDVAALAAQLGRPADRLYYHCRLLQRGGLLQQVDGDARARRYRLAGPAGQALWLDYRGDSDARAAVTQVIDGMLHIAQRDFRAALAEPRTVLAGERRELWAARSKGWVNAAEVAEINRLLARLEQLLLGPRRPGRDRLMSLSFVLAPLAPAPRRAKAGTARRRDEAPARR